MGNCRYYSEAAVPGVTLGYREPEAGSAVFNSIVYLGKREYYISKRMLISPKNIILNCFLGNNYSITLHQNSDWLQL